MFITPAIQSIDETLFHLINQVWTNRFLDAVLPPIRDRLFFIPIYILIAIAIIYTYKKKSIYLILLLSLNFTLSDQISSAVVKPLVNRDRPCNDIVYKNEVRLLVDGCGGGKSFTSSHATNTFAFAMLLTLLFAKRYKWVFYATFLWAFAVSYAQIYVGVHYPIDVFGGALLGMLLSIFVYYLGKLFLPKLIKEL